MNQSANEIRLEDLQHPCYNAGVCRDTGRLHIPIAAACNIQCNYCSRRYDCVNESRPGVTSRLLEIEDLVPYIERQIGEHPSIRVIGIAGPGDPLANPDVLLPALEIIRRTFPDMQLCLSTNGLMLPEMERSITEAGVGYVTVTVNTLQPQTAALIYQHVDCGGTVLRGEEGGACLISRQSSGIRKLKERGIKIKINSVFIPGINENEMKPIALFARENGALVHNIIPIIPVPGTAFGTLPVPDMKKISAIRAKCAAIIPEMTHCRQCRADSAGLLTD